VGITASRSVKEIPSSWSPSDDVASGTEKVEVTSLPQAVVTPSIAIAATGPTHETVRMLHRSSEGETDRKRAKRECASSRHGRLRLEPSRARTRHPREAGAGE
jgi:hypothetical protein